MVDAYDEYEDPDFYEDYDDPYMDHQDSQRHSKDFQPSHSEEQKFEDILFQKTNSYYCLDEQRIQKHIKELMNDLIENWGLSQSQAIALLKKNDWDKEKANRYVSEDGVFDMMEVQKGGNDKEFDCPVCFCPEEVSKGYSFNCNHLYCSDCFLGYLDSKISEGQTVMNCPMDKCKEIFTPELAKKFLKGALYDKYQKFFKQTIVDGSQDLMWCPSPKCDLVLQLIKMKKNKRTLRNIRCDCGHCFCFNCTDIAHRPLLCEKFEKWMTMVGGKDDSLNEGWIKKNTKRCPKCSASIEKNQGCMHMTCSNCRHEFCWLCTGDWKQHGSSTGGYYECNKFKKIDKALDDDEREFEKFTFYRDRFENHNNSLKFALKKKDQILQNFKNINEIVHEMKDDSFMKEALDIIIEARRAITFTYAVAYFVTFTEVEKEMFEMQQSMLWTSLDNLDKSTDDLQDGQKMVETLIDEVQGKQFLAGKFNDYKSQLNGKVAGVTTACNKLLKYIEQDLQDANRQKLFAEDTKQLKLQKKLSKEASLYKSEYWYCAYCTYANPQSSTKRCDICQKEKKVLKGPIP